MPVSEQREPPGINCHDKIEVSRARLEKTKLCLVCVACGGFALCWERLLIGRVGSPMDTLSKVILK